MQFRQHASMYILSHHNLQYFSFLLDSYVAEADGALDKARKHKKRQLEDTLNLVLKKRKVFYFIYLQLFAVSLRLKEVGNKIILP